MTITEFIDASKDQISANSEHPRRDILDFLLKELNTSESEIIATPNTQLSKSQESTLSGYVKRQSDGEPHAYVLGETEFYGLKITLPRKVLIPRPETEQLVELLINDLEDNQHILEVGVGSGCITTAVLNEARNLGKGIHYTGIDPNLDAIENTRANLELHNLKAKDLLNLGIQEFDQHKFQVIISNPPYLTRIEMNELAKSVSDFEPSSALFGGETGTDIYKEIYNFAIQHERLPSIYLEISPTIATMLKSMFSEAYSEVKILEDLFGEERFLIAKN